MNRLLSRLSSGLQLRHRITCLILLMLVAVTSLLGGCTVEVSQETQGEDQGLSIVYESDTDLQETETVLAIEDETDSDMDQASISISETEAWAETKETISDHGDAVIAEDGSYTSKEEVALYIHTYGRLPDNFISKKDAEDLGWNSSKGNLWQVADGMSIGGSYFGNYEGLLPKESGRKYYECDIDYTGGYRGAKRIIYSNDGLIFYTEDHYESFEQLY